MTLPFPQCIRTSPLRDKNRDIIYNDAKISLEYDIQPIGIRILMTVTGFIPINTKVFLDPTNWLLVPDFYTAAFFLFKARGVFLLFRQYNVAPLEIEFTFNRI